MTPSDARTARPRLTKERVVRAAVDLADREGLDALTMRRLGAELGVQAMSLYKHCANKDELLDGIVDHVIAEIELPAEGVDWRDAMRRRAISAREVLTRHSWAVGLMEARSSMGPAVLRYVDAILGSLRSAGFTIENAVHAFWLLDNYVYGQVVQETSMPFGTSQEAAESDESALRQLMATEYPTLVEVAEHASRSDYSVDAEFEFGLDLLLDALSSLVT